MSWVYSPNLIFSSLVLDTTGSCLANLKDLAGAPSYVAVLADTLAVMTTLVVSHAAKSTLRVDDTTAKPTSGHCKSIHKPTNSTFPAYPHQIWVDLDGSCAQPAVL